MKLNMKLLIEFMLLCILILVSACSTPRTIQNSGEQLASVLGVDPSDFRFMSYCGYSGQLQTPANERIKPTPRLVALTKTDLYLLEVRRASDVSKEGAVRIPISEMEGISLNVSQITLRYNSKEILLIPAERRAKPDKEASRDLFWILARDGVPEFESNKLYATSWDLYWNMFVEGPRFQFGLPSNDFR